MPNPGPWSELYPDLLESIFERLCLADVHRAKLVCLNWNTSSKRSVARKIKTPWLIVLFVDDEKDVYVLYNPNEDRIYKPVRDFSGIRFLANSGKWFLMLDSGCNLYIMDVFSEKRIDLPPLESLVSSTYALKPSGYKEYSLILPGGSCCILNTSYLRSRLWVDEKTGEFVLVLFFDPSPYLFYCKNGDNHYTVIPVDDKFPNMLQGVTDLVLWGYRLYIASNRRCVRVIDLSGHEGFEDVTGSNPKPMLSPLGEHDSFNIVVTTAGEVLLVESTTVENQRTFRIYKKNPNADPEDQMPHLVEVDSLGDEALLLDLGTTVPSNHALGIQPNTIYFTRHNRVRFRMSFDLEICVFNLATNTLIKHFPHLANLKPRDALWFLPMT
ncbi:unnamed protein product [Arabidopsis lyrata]|uniref:F-box domain-containing protein n=1 Tax=Arabidopsis lyrata subsp. lyrata TaxID=81972 RepID=D7LA88_ARALL|nr:F-box protein At2g14290 [Arabidopsis lyrata subsp. lyrata]EFH60011.1 hypothetical protein ARALYDRAFT_899448 [Arabidopsis lyrata subsp. lyrata]CAH8262071.1 unnamed protein product [Arabidopsis lyrata]|eukprot:XP_002883752.1 F-box protein At2g14290 [Arabidopsis lyrata subsp. lyrata]